MQVGSNDKPGVVGWLKHTLRFGKPSGKFDIEPTQGTMAAHPDGTPQAKWPVTNVSAQEQMKQIDQ